MLAECDSIIQCYRYFGKDLKLSSPARNVAVVAGKRSCNAESNKGIRVTHSEPLLRRKSKSSPVPSI
jgi:hypothetical protein